MWQQLVSAFLVELGWIPPPHWASAEEEGQFKWPEVLVGCAQPCPGGLLRAGAHRYHVTTLPLWHVWNVGQDGKPELCVFPLCPEWQDLFLFNIYLFTYWAAPGHSCSMWNLVPWPVLEPRTPAWEHGVLATGPPGKSWIFFFMLLFLSMVRTYPGITKVGDALCCLDLKPPESCQVDWQCEWTSIFIPLWWFSQHCCCNDSNKYVQLVTRCQ